ncbi:MAG: hypothetical protein OD814_001339 [Candidatus Alkanophagales archaeon MCA70_species_1]|nr:hypothetical protein [Candidatus Alkanophaga volatiphilum]
MERRKAVAALMIVAAVAGCITAAAVAAAPSLSLKASDIAKAILPGGIINPKAILPGSITGAHLANDIDISTTGSISADTGISTTGTLTASNVDIDGGSIDGTTIGANSAAAGTFTDLEATNSITLNNLIAEDDTAAGMIPHNFTINTTSYKVPNSYPDWATVTASVTTSVARNLLIILSTNQTNGSNDYVRAKIEITNANPSSIELNLTDWSLAYTNQTTFVFATQSSDGTSTVSVKLKSGKGTAVVEGTRLAVIAL